jgi:hypothetical protein
MPALLALRGFAVVLVLVGVLPLANMLTEGRAVGWYAGAVREWLERGTLLVAVLLVVSRYFGAWLDVAIERVRAAVLRPSPGVFAVATAVLATVAAAAVSQIAFAGQPFTSDEMAQAWHARIIASGNLYAIAETPREFFNTAPVLDTGGRWFSQYPIGGPALIALGLLVGLPWLVNPILLGVATVALYRFFAAVSGELRARFATLLFVSSPMVLQMAGSQMNHLPALAFTALALWDASRWDSADSPRKLFTTAALTGLGIGAIALVRPLDAALVALVIGVVQVARALREPKRWVSLGVQAAFGALPVAVLLWANAKTTGSPFVFAYEALNGASHGLGFHVDPNGEAHTPMRGLTFASGYLMKLSLFLFEWPLPGVLVIAAGLAAIRRPNRWDLVLAGLFAAFLVAYAAYWFDGFFAGPRFLFGAVPAFIYFATRLPDIAGDAPHPVVRRTLSLILPLCVAIAWLGPWAVSSASSRIDLYREQRTKQKTAIEDQVRAAGLSNALVFVPEDWNGDLLTRLRIMGANQFLANRIVTQAGLCAAQTALDSAALSPDPDSVKVRRLAQRDWRVFLSTGRPGPACVAAAARDSAGTMPFTMFLAHQHVQRDGRIGGNVVFARDLGARNEELRLRFGARAWYRYVPLPPDAPSRPVFIPYSR